MGLTHVPGLVLEVQVGSTMSVWVQIIEKTPQWVENRRLGPKQRLNESYGLSGPIRTTHKAKNAGKKLVFKENGPRRRAGGTVGPCFIGY